MMPYRISGLGSPLLNLPHWFKPMAAPHAKPVARLSLRQQFVISGFLFLLSLLMAVLMVAYFYPGILAQDKSAAQLARNIGFGGGVLSFSLALLTAFYRHWAPLTAPIYALAGGIFMSGLALAFEQRFPGIALQSLAITACIVLIMYLLYATGVVRVSRKLFVITYAATATIALIYLFGFLLILTGVSFPFLHGAGVGGMLWFGFIIVIAVLNLLVDFRRIDSALQHPQPPWMPWYLGLGLQVTMVWMYVSVLRLMANVRR